MPTKALVYPQPQLLKLLDLVLCYDGKELQFSIQKLMIEAKIPVGTSLYHQISIWTIMNDVREKPKLINFLDVMLDKLHTNKKFYKDKIQNYSILG